MIYGELPAIHAWDYELAQLHDELQELNSFPKPATYLAARP